MIITHLKKMACITVTAAKNRFLLKVGLSSIPIHMSDSVSIVPIVKKHSRVHQRILSTDQAAGATKQVVPNDAACGGAPETKGTCQLH